MLMLRLVRFVCFALMNVALVLGVVSLFQGNWLRVLLCVVAFFVIGVGFSLAHKDMEKVTRTYAMDDLQQVATAMAVQDWDGALSAATRNVKRMSSRVKEVGSASELHGALATSLLLQGVLYGANGMTLEAHGAISRAQGLLRKIPNPNDLGRELSDMVAHCDEGLRLRANDPLGARQFCRDSAVQLLS